jgi:hypothetical protein
MSRCRGNKLTILNRSSQTRLQSMGLGNPFWHDGLGALSLVPRRALLS